MTVTQIRIGKHNTGIIGLNAILTEIASQTKDMQDNDIAKLMVEQVSLQNYIPSNVTDLYETALVINGKVAAVGSIPSRAKLLALIQKAELKVPSKNP
jgi:hypothetical protein